MTCRTVMRCRTASRLGRAAVAQHRSPHTWTCRPSYEGCGCDVGGTTAARPRTCPRSSLTVCSVRLTGFAPFPMEPFQKLDHEGVSLVRQAPTTLRIHAIL